MCQPRRCLPKRSVWGPRRMTFPARQCHTKVSAAEPALNLLATIVRGADTDRLDLAPQSAGLLALSLGFSRLHAGDDLAMLEAAMPLYDALYAWCRDKVSATDEPHNWKPESMAGAKA